MPASVVGRRSLLRGMAGPGALLGLKSFARIKPPRALLVDTKDSIKITRLETLSIKPGSPS